MQKLDNKSIVGPMDLRLSPYDSKYMKKNQVKLVKCALLSQT